MQVTSISFGQTWSRAPRFKLKQRYNLPRFAGGLNVARGAKRATASGSAAGHSVTTSVKGAGFNKAFLPATMPSM